MWLGFLKEDDEKREGRGICKTRELSGLCGDYKGFESDVGTCVG